MDSIIRSFLCKLNRDNHFTEIQLEQIRYSILAIGGDLSKFLILLVLFSLLGHCPEYLYSFFTTTLLRVYIGGKHFNTYLGCLTFSTMYFSLTIFLTTLMTSQYYQYLLLLSIISAVVLLVIAPRISKKSGRNFKINIYKVKLIILFLVTLYIVIYFVEKEPIYAIGPFTIIFQTIQLLMMKGESYYEIRKETKISA